MTLGTRDATSTDIADYNAFVQAQAALAGLDNLFGQAVTWKAIASTSTMDARDNIGDPTAPIYKTDGVLIASNETDLFDGSISSALDRDQSGNLRNIDVWTGSLSDGTAAVGNSLGNPFPVAGLSVDTDDGWLSDLIFFASTESRSLYAISDELTAPIPTPAAAWAGIAAFAAMATCHSRRTRT